MVLPLSSLNETETIVPPDTVNVDGDGLDVVSDDKCHLLSGQFGLIVQLFLGFLSLLALFIKWRRENHRRSLTVWKYDVLKQNKDHKISLASFGAKSENSNVHIYNVHGRLLHHCLRT
mmetsp:Transcript_36138/g.44983  ORF Transcript_36138/g.44983 Transcript_36138/m.44983 type:complete len:118 (+) Transcript_36138:134-487(+)